MKKRMLALLQALVLLTAVSACGASGEETEEVLPPPEIFNMGTGSRASVDYAFGSLIAGYMSNKDDRVVRVMPSEGFAANIISIGEGTNQLGLAQSDVMAHAWNGEYEFKETGEVQSFRTLGALYEETVQIVTRDENIKTVADLEGKMVSIGAPDSGVYYNALAILDAYDMTENDIEAAYLTFEESAEAMADGKIDAVFMLSGTPNDAVAEFAAENQVYLVNIEGEKLNTLLERCPYYQRHVIPGGTYKGMDADVNTVSTQVAVVVSADLPEKQVYRMTASLYENLDAVSAILNGEIQLSLEKATTGVTIPFHPGAEKYFKEKEIEIPAE